MNDKLKHPWVITALTLSAFISAFFLDYLENTVGSTHMLIGALYTIAIVMIAMVIFSLFSRLEVRQEYTKQVDILKGFIEANGLGQIINELQLQAIERKTTSIWVFTLDLANDLGPSVKDGYGQVIFEAVKSNLKDGKRYTYFVPDTPKIHGAIEEYFDKHSFVEGQVTFCVIPFDQFHFISELVIYGAESSMETLAFQWFPSNKLNYYFKLDEAHRRDIVGVARQMLRKHPQITKRNNDFDDLISA